MDCALTRRGLVAAAPAAMVAASLPALAAGASADATLLALRPKWLLAMEVFEATFGPLAVAEERHRAARLPRPARDTFDGSEAEYAMAVALVLQRNEKLEGEVGLTRARQRQSAASDVECGLVGEIFDIQARTVEGIRFKLEVMKSRAGSETEEMEPSLRSDLLEMVGIYDA